MAKVSLSEDELMRQLVGAIAATVAKLLALKNAGQFQQALEEIDQLLEEILALKADLARRLSDEQIIEMLTTQEYLDTGSLYYVAELFKAEGEIYLSMGEMAHGQASLGRALNFFIEVGFASEEAFPEADERIDELFASLGAALPEETLFALFDYYEQTGAYAQAEAALGLMLLVTGNAPEILAEKRAFHERLNLEGGEPGQEAE
jgi:tetratricopeptide (TPR) repeat protein